MNDYTVILTFSIQMLFLMNQEIKRMVFIATKVLLGIFILIYFDASLVTCNEDIPFCKESLKSLKDDVKDWQARCSISKLDGYGYNYTEDLDTPCCNAEKDYIQNRRRMQKKLCFYKGN